jgi:hypothetical protein
MTENKPFLGKIKVKNAAHGYSAFPPFKTAIDTAFLAMLAAMLIAALNLYFRHKGINEKGVLMFVLFGFGAFLSYFLSIWVFAALIPAFPRFRIFLTGGVFFTALFGQLLIPSALYRMVSNIQFMADYIDIDKISPINVLANSPTMTNAFKAIHVWYPLGLAIPIILALYFLKRSSPVTV